MSTLHATDDSPIRTADDLAAWLALGCKPKTRWRIGTEHEKFCFYLENHGPVPYTGERGIEALLRGLIRFGWEEIRENGHLIALTRDGASVALEPGGQVELSGAPVADLHMTDHETSQHLAELRQVAEPLGIGLLGMGFQPIATSAELPWVPKTRYRVMQAKMAASGEPRGSGLAMMQRTSSIQVNLDFESEADMAVKMRVGLALQPLTLALFAASPFADGKPTGFKSWRMQIWNHMDPARTGLLPFVFEKNFDFRRYVEYALDLPLYFLWRDGQYIDAGGQSFRDFMAGELAARPGDRPTLGDWADHLSSLFPDVRLRHYIEFRSADCGPRPHLTALPAFWTGLLYDQQSLAKATEIVSPWSYEELVKLRLDAARFGLAATIQGRSLAEIALDILPLARNGLARRAILREGGQDETRYLEPLFRIAESGETVADALLQSVDGDLHGETALLLANCRL